MSWKLGRIGSGTKCRIFLSNIAVKQIQVSIVNKGSQFLLYCLIFFAGYKVGDFRLSEIFDIKLKEEIERTKNELTKAQRIHESEVQEINEKHGSEVDKIRTTYEASKAKLVSVIQDNESNIEKLELSILGNEKDIQNIENEKLVLTNELEDLEKILDSELNASASDKLEKLTLELERKNIKITSLEKDNRMIKNEKIGLECLNVQVPSELRSIP